MSVCVCLSTDVSPSLANRSKNLFRVFFVHHLLLSMQAESRGSCQARVRQRKKERETDGLGEWLGVGGLPSLMTTSFGELSASQGITANWVQASVVHGNPPPPCWVGLGRAPSLCLGTWSWGGTCNSHNLHFFE